MSEENALTRLFDFLDENEEELARLGAIVDVRVPPLNPQKRQQEIKDIERLRDISPEELEAETAILMDRLRVLANNKKATQ